MAQWIAELRVELDGALRNWLDGKGLQSVEFSTSGPLVVLSLHTGRALTNGERDEVKSALQTALGTVASVITFSQRQIE